ncbi:MAG: group 1 truncated hemoglobin [Ginsengibacter sp.]
MKNLIIVSIITLSFSSVIFQSCKTKDKPNPPAQPTLYDSLGGTAMVADPTTSGAKIEAGRLLIRNILDSTIFVVAGDTAINGHFVTLLTEVKAGNLSGFQAFSKNLTDFVSVATGAKDYTYTGLDMVTAHDPAKNPRMKGGKADNGDMDAFEKDLVTGAAQAGVPSSTPALQSVAKIVESLRSQIVQQ